MQRCAALALALLTACAGGAARLHGTIFTPPQPAKPFTLTDQYGRPFSPADARGSALALYFGFTHCRDVCPQTLAMLERARTLAGLHPEQLRIVMISVDPARDTRWAMRRFFSRIGVRALGLTGSPRSLASVYREYGVAVVQKARDIAHTSSIFLVDRHGRLIELLDPQTPAEDVAPDLRAAVR